MSELQLHETPQYKSIIINDPLEFYLYNKTNAWKNGFLTEEESKRVRNFMRKNPYTTASWLAKYEAKQKELLNSDNALERIEAKYALEKIKPLWPIVERLLEDRMALAKKQCTIPIKAASEPIEKYLGEDSYQVGDFLIPMLRYSIDGKVFEATPFHCQCKSAQYMASKQMGVCKHVLSARALVKDYYNDDKRYMDFDTMCYLNAMFDLSLDRGDSLKHGDVV